MPQVAIMTSFAPARGQYTSRVMVFSTVFRPMSLKPSTAISSASVLPVPTASTISSSGEPSAKVRTPSPPTGRPISSSNARARSRSNSAK